MDKKRLGAFALFACLVCFTGCGKNQSVQADKTITCGEVIAAYENAGYEVFHHETTEGLDYVCSVKATDLNSGKYIYFHFFETPEQATAYADEREYNVLLWFFSVLYGEPSWLTTRAYNNIEIEYDQGALYEPFGALI